LVDKFAAGAGADFNMFLNGHADAQSLSNEAKLPTTTG